jgi:hypothetical protein
MKHEMSEKHVQRIESLKSTKEIEVVRNPTVAEETAVAMACHSSISLWIILERLWLKWQSEVVLQT